MFGRKKKVVVIETLPHMYESEALEVTINGKPVEVLGRWNRYRDGGTSEVRTNKGEIFRPAPRNELAKPLLDNQEIDLEWIVKDTRKD